MQKLSAKGQKWLKSFHILFSCLWVGGAVSLTIMIFDMKDSDGILLPGIIASIKFIDDFIIVPGALGLLLTGLIYSIFTKWGWFKHNWIIVKWIITLYGVIFGTFFLGPWINSMPQICETEGLNIFSNKVFLSNLLMSKLWGTFQLATILFAVFISIFKPWKKKRNK